MWGQVVPAPPFSLPTTGLLYYFPFDCHVGGYPVARIEAHTSEPPVAYAAPCLLLIFFRNVLALCVSTPTSGAERSRDRGRKGDQASVPSGSAQDASGCEHVAQRQGRVRHRNPSYCHPFRCARPFSTHFNEPPEFFSFLMLPPVSRTRSST